MIIKVKCLFDNRTLRFATVNLQESNAVDPGDRGNWENKIVGLSSLSRNIGEDKSYEVSGMSIIFDDTDRRFRRMMSGSDRYIVGRKVELYTMDDQLIYTGTVDKWKFMENRFELVINDKLSCLDVIVPDMITPTEYPGMAPEADGKSIPIVYGDISADNGALKCWKIAPGKYLAADHPVRGLGNVYDKDGNPLTASLFNDHYGEVVPGKKRAYVLYDGSDLPFIRVNLEGKPDTRGYLMDDPIHVMRDMLEQLNIRRPGAGIGYNDDEMNRVQAIMANRKYKIAAVVDNGQTLNKVLMDFCFSFDCDFNIGRGYEIVLSMLNWTLLTARKTFSPSQILQFQMDERSENIRNKIYYNYKYHYAEGRFQKTPIYGKPSSIENWGEFFVPNQPLELTYVADDITAGDVAQRYLIQRRNPRRIARMGIPLEEFVGLDVSDVIEVWHPNAIDESVRKYQLRRIEIDFIGDIVDVEAEDITYMTGGTFLLGNRAVLPRFWNDAVGTQRDYGYLAHKIDGLFGNDTDYGKGLY